MNILTMVVVGFSSVSQNVKEKVKLTGQNLLRLTPVLIQILDCNLAACFASAGVVQKKWHKWAGWQSIAAAF